MSSNSKAAAPIHDGRLVRVLRFLAAAWAALTTGSRLIPFGDNGTLFRELAARVSASKNRL